MIILDKVEIIWEDEKFIISKFKGQLNEKIGFEEIRTHSKEKNITKIDCKTFPVLQV